LERLNIKQSLDNIQSPQISFDVDLENTKTQLCPIPSILVEDIFSINEKVMDILSLMAASEFLDSINNGSINKLNRGNKHKS